MEINIKLNRNKENKDNIGNQEFDDVLLDSTRKNLDSQSSRFRDIDTKAIGIIALIGVLMTLLIKPTNCDIKSIPYILYIITSISFSLSTMFCIGAIKIRQYEYLSTYNLVSLYQETDIKRQKRRMIRTIADIEEDICKKADNKVKWLKRSIYMLGVSIILYSIYSIIK